MALSVKAYINPDTNQQEIRRFAIDEGASANFDYLRQKIEQVFPSVRGKAFKLFWKGKFNWFVLNFVRLDPDSHKFFCEKLFQSVAVSSFYG